MPEILLGKQESSVFSGVYVCPKKLYEINLAGGAYQGISVNMQAKL